MEASSGDVRANYVLTVDDDADEERVLALAEPALPVLSLVLIRPF